METIKLQPMTISCVPGDEFYCLRPPKGYHSSEKRAKEGREEGREGENERRETSGSTRCSDLFVKRGGC